MNTKRLAVTIATLASVVIVATTVRPVAAVSPAGAGSDSATAARVVVTQLTDQERSDLLFMREEEKLAHDVYQQLYETWGLPVFQNIAASEQTHMNAVKTLLDRYQIPDPVAGNEAGVFVNPELQELYNRLVLQGMQSLGAALRVGGAIEEIDILDLQETIARTSKRDIKQVYQNLLQGSYNHLRAFVSTLKTQTGETYQPQYLTQAAFDSIIGASNGQGGGRRR